MSHRCGAWALVAAAAIGLSCTVSPPAPLHSPSQSLATDQSLRVRLIDPIGTVDPALANNTSDMAVTRQLAEPLLRGAPGLLDVEPAAAESYEISDDGLTATFHLRANGHFADGTSVRAADFVQAWRRVIDPNTLSPAADVFAAVVKGGEEAQSLDPKLDAGRLKAALDNLGLKAVDDLTFAVTLPRPAAQLKWVASLVQGAPAGNGAFRLAGHTKDRADLTASDSYWGGRPTLSKLSFEVVSDDAVALSRYQAGGFDVSQSTAGDLSGSEVVKVPALSQYWIYFNTGRPPFDNAKVRQAFAMALDRAPIVKDAFANRARPADSLVPRGMRGYRSDLGALQDFNSTQARQTLDASGVPKDQLSSIHYLVRTNPVERAVADQVAAQVKQNLGLTLVLDVVDAAEGGGRLRAGDFQLGGVDGWAADYPDQQNWFDLFRSNDGNNLSRWRNPRYDLLVKQADGELDPVKRDDLYGQAHELLAADAPVAFLAQLQNWYLVKPYVKGLVVTSADEWPGAVHTTRIYINAHR
jgi:oligopeptide transport system substrate-binding protein